MGEALMRRPAWWALILRNMGGSITAILQVDSARRRPPRVLTALPRNGEYGG
jgi:hypothetical protein